MALSTRTIADTINWAKRFNFNRNPVIGNSLEPALTCASLVIQTILSPPFDWWWNNQELVFTCNPVPNAATSTVIGIAAGVLTVTATNTFKVGDVVIASAIAGSSAALNGLVLVIATASSSQFTATVTLPNSTDTVGVFTNVTTQDYTVPGSTLSHISHASILDLNSDGTPNKWMQLTVKNDLAFESSQNRPEFIGVNSQDGNGNIVFRVFSSPDKKYPVSVHIDLAAPAITSINQTWAPLPDFLQYIYDWGFLALMWQFSDDPRAAYANNQFKAALLGRQQGLSEEQKNIFLNNWEALQDGYVMKMQQGIMARGQ
jgi:hypothetical protein